MLNKALSILMPIFAGIVILIAVMAIVSQLSCMSAPDTEDYAGRPNACYDFADCLYRNEKNPDKSVCSDTGKECRAWERFAFCKDEKNRPDKMDFEKCWLLLNQK